MASLEELINDLKNVKLDDRGNVKIHLPTKKLRFSTRCSGFIKRLKNRLASQTASKVTGPMSRIDQIMLRMYESNNRTISGDSMLNEIIAVMSEYYQGDVPFILRVDQYMMVSHILCAFLPFLYKDNLEANKDRLLARLKVPRIKELLVIIASRRVGKSTCIAYVVASIMIVVPYSTGAIFSLAQRASKRVMQMIISFLNMHPRGRALLEKKDTVKNFEELRLTGDSPTDLKVLFAFPDSGDVCFIYFPYY